MHRMRSGFVEEHTAFVNRLRGLLIEFGVFLPQAIEAFRSRFSEALEDATSEMTDAVRMALIVREIGPLRSTWRELET